MSNEKLIYASAARRAILKANPSLAYVIDEVKAVDAVEVVHAHWIYDGDEVDGNMQAHCSNCFAGDVHATWKKNDNIPHCWNCGAKMDGGNVKKQLELVETINNYFGVDAAYFDVDAFTLAKRIMEAGWEKPVRCKDCKHYKQNPWSKEENMMCMCWCDWLATDPDDFCSNGERREGE